MLAIDTMIRLKWTLYFRSGKQTNFLIIKMSVAEADNNPV
jgi:hypothetical protein